MSKPNSIDASNKLATQAVHAGESPPFWGRSLILPIAQTSTYVFESVAELKAYKAGELDHAEYGRYRNPTVDVVERKLAALEGAEAALLFSSGMAAQAITLLTVLSRDTHILAIDDMYPGTLALFETVFPRFGISYTLVPCDDPAAIQEAATRQTSVLFCEFPTNPHLRVADLHRLSELATQNRWTFVVDSTLASPAAARPLALGADLVIHSCTKYLGGHNDLMAGVVCGDAAKVGAIREQNSAIGAIISPHDAWLLNRGIKTLKPRFEQQSQAAATLATRLAEHPAIAEVFYPGYSKSDSDPAGALLPGHRGGLLSFRPEGGAAVAENVLDNLQLFAHAASLGGVESMAQITYLFVALPGAEIPLAIEPDLIRISVGLEDVEELWNDLNQALTSAGGT